MNHRDRKRRNTAVAAGLLLSVTVLCGGAAAQDPEFRAMWVTRFEWPSSNPAVSQATIDDVMQDLAASNFNAVFFQVRGQADVLYPSPDEVWSPLIGGVDPGWDPLAYAIDAAHANGIEFHAYINTHTCWQSSSDTPPTNPDHLFFAHCNAADPAARDWLIHDVSGQPVQWHESDYVWIAPGVPEFQAYIRRQVLHVVENYDVDGVHFDRIRTPNSGFSYDPISLARFSDPQSNPNALDFSHWTRDQITRNVRDIYAEIAAVKPQLKVSAAVFPNSVTAPSSQHQEALVWAQTGGMDTLVPMMYFTGGAGSTWDTRLQQWLAGSGGRHVVAGQITTEGQSALLDQIGLTRLRGGEGNSIFSWGSFTLWAPYLAQVYQTPVALPAMAWKDTPATGIVYGYVTSGDGSSPVIDAQVTRSGSAYVGLATGDGFYSFLLVPPGTYTLTASHPGYGETVLPGVEVLAGEVTRRDIDLGVLLPPVIAEVSPDPDQAVVQHEYARQLILTQGTADSWIMLDGPPGASVDTTGRVSGWTPAGADAGQTFDFAVRASNATTSDDESWTVTVIDAPPCATISITDFEGFASGAQVLFNRPRFSGTTIGDLATEPDQAEVTDAVDAFSGDSCSVVRWRYLDTSPERWMRLTTFNADSVPNPTIQLDRPLRVRVRVDAGRFRLAVGVRETATTAELGADGGTSGSIEWIGAASDMDGAPQGVLVEANPGVWQTFLFDPLSDPIHSFTGDGALATVTNRGVFEHLAFSVVDTVGPLTVYIDDVDLLCGLPAFGDLNHDGDVGLDDYALFHDCRQGPGVTVAGACLEADSDGDADVDLGDAAALLAAFTDGN